MKIRRISDFQTEISFPQYVSNYALHKKAFKQTDLGKIHRAIPWDKLVSCLGLVDSKKGPTSTFSPKGKLALMFLKHHACCSDKKLIEQLNGNLHYQMFCDIWLGAGNLLSNYKMVSEIRCEIAKKLDMNEMEKVLMHAWKPFMKDLNSITCDATCYESHIRYPTDVKLLWASVEWSFSQLTIICRQAKLPKMRSKLNKWASKYVSYSKMKRKTKKKRRALSRALLLLLAKVDAELDRLALLKLCPQNKTYLFRRKTIKTILAQQHALFHEGIKPKNRIVSIDKPYIRPIVRGKEIKGVEFGAKVHKLQIDGISFIEHLSFDAFNEGTRLASTLIKAQGLTNKMVKLLGADAIYATNANRKMVTQLGIQTDFKRKGRAGKHDKAKQQIARMITKERASRLEGSFGTDKEFFLLNQIRARTQKTEILWIFIGIHTSNALNIGRRMTQTIAIAA